MDYKIAVIKGDGIGPEIVDASLTVLERVAKKYKHTFNFTDVLMGGCAIDATGVPLPPETVEICKSSHAVLLGAVGGPKWDTLPGNLRPEKGLLGIRAALGLFANIRPALLHPALIEACPLRRDIAERGIDMIVVRELTGGIYFGERGYLDGGDKAFDTELYSTAEIERIVRLAFNIARGRKKHVISVDKANVLESSRLWRAVTAKVAKEFPDCTVENMLVDNAAMQLVKNPAQFDVMVTSNMFGDILSDEAAQITGSIGMLASSSMNSEKLGLYEPIHGSAPDIAGKDLANPLATILSCAMMLRSSLELETEAAAVENAVQAVLKKGWRTADIAFGAEKSKITGCKQMGALVAAEV